MIRLTALAKSLLLVALLGFLASCGSDSASPPGAVAGPRAGLDELAQTRVAPPVVPDEISPVHIQDPVSGTVLGPDGKPVAGARVRLFQRLRRWPRRDRTELDLVRSGGSGQFVLAHPKGADLEVEVEAAGCARTIRAVPLPGLGTLMVRLPRGGRVGGQVLLPSGQVASGCWVCLEPGTNSVMRARETHADPQGRFYFDSVPADQLRLTARHEAYQPVTAGNIAVGRNIQLKLEERVIGLSGTVTVGDRPLSGCEVRVYPETKNGLLYVPYEATTNNLGEYTIRGLGQGLVSVQLQHESFGSTQRVVTVSRSRTDLDFELQPKLRVAGRLLGIKSKEPLQLELVSRFGEVGTAEVAANGTFAFGGGFSKGLATFEIRNGAYGFQASQSRWVQRVLTHDANRLQFAIEPATELAGVVETIDGTPVEGVEVLAASEQAWWSPKSFQLVATQQQVLAVTDSGGNYSVRGLEPGDMHLVFHAAQFAFQQEKVQVSTKSEPVLVPTVRLEPPGMISGRVTRDGQPVVGALVSTAIASNRAMSDLDGAFVLRGLPPGDHGVRVKYRTLPVSAPQVVQLAPGQRALDVNVSLPVGRRVTGRVRDADDVPLANVLIESQAGTVTKSDDSGRFEIDVLPGRSTLLIRSSEFDLGAQRVPVARDIQDLAIRLRKAPRAGLQAKVSTLPKETPVTGLMLRLDAGTDPAKAMQVGAGLNQLVSVLSRMNELNEHHIRGHLERWIEVPEGELLVHNLAQGMYSLHLAAKGFQPLVRPVMLFNGKIQNLGEIKLEPGFRVHGVVVDPNGKPVPGARVVLGRESDLTLDGARLTEKADRNGRFAVDGVGLNSQDLFVAALGYATVYHRINLETDIMRTSTDPVVVQMQAGVTIKAALVNLKNEPVPFKKVQLNRGPNRLREVETDQEGIAWFHNLRKGAYSVYLLGRLRSTQAVTIRDTRGGRVYEVKVVDAPRRAARSRAR